MPIVTLLGVGSLEVEAGRSRKGRNKIPTVPRCSSPTV